MTVKELIIKLLDMPQEANIALDIVYTYNNEAYSHSDDAKLYVIENLDEEVIIQAID